MKGLNSLAKTIYEGNLKKGFWEKGKEKEKNFGQVIALIHSELSEALEADRDDRRFDDEYYDLKFVLHQKDEDFIGVFKALVKDRVEDEMADVIIRVLDYCGAMGIDIEGHVEAKLRYNATRTNRHGRNY